MQTSIRKVLRQIRKSIPSIQKNHLALALAKQFEIYFPKLTNKNIASYFATDEEISPYYINQRLKAKNNLLYYPILHSFHTRHLWFSVDTQKYARNKYQLLEPIFYANNILAPWELDIIIIPLVGFNKHKQRIGMGGGFYDTTLRYCKKFNNVQFIGIAFDEQQHDSVAMNSWDITMDAIITPTKIIN
ncbi:5-formyltetrahydrofolate cyclo-ligase [Fastidiosibacter lacustris]|uniref:5-formyltetrahydrofolate cyclo-ligase n=1 Tax=Fastidiosibacter lacustris TaxID=2056695 RepID=UPI000E34FFA6|nr:5-formyltetrahydrofolate cyclo-ligase [Fastidiosibacter lacustris]